MLDVALALLALLLNALLLLLLPHLHNKHSCISSYFKAPFIGL
jgi:hypothetical protein